MDKERLDDLAEKTGEKRMKPAPKMNYSSVRLHGKKGCFEKRTYKDGETKTEEIGEEIEGVIIRVRNKYLKFTKKEMFFTPESDSRFDAYPLFRRRKLKDGGWGKPQILQEARGTELKDKYDLPTIKILYLYDLETVVKVSVKGSGLATQDDDKKLRLFDYFRELDDTHVFEVVTEIGMSQETSPMGDYYAMTFAKGRELEDEELQKVAERIDELNEEIRVIEERYADKEEESEEGESEDIPVVEEDEEIKVEDIPF